MLLKSKQFSIGISVEEINLVLTDKDDFESRDKSELKTAFGTFGVSKIYCNEEYIDLSIKVFPQNSSFRYKPRVDQNQACF